PLGARRGPGSDGALPAYLALGALGGGDQHQDLLDDLLDPEAGGVHRLDPLGGRVELGDGGVVAVAAQHLVGHPRAGVLVVLEIELGGAPSHALLVGGRQQHPHVRVRGDDGRDVAPFGDAESALGGRGEEQLPLPALQDRAHQRVGRDGADLLGDPLGADLGGDVGAGDDDGRAGGIGALGEVDLLGRTGHGLTVGEIDALVQAPPGHAAVHRPGVQDPAVEGIQHHPRDGGLAGAGRAVDRDGDAFGRAGGREVGGGMRRAGVHPARIRGAQASATLHPRSVSSRVSRSSRAASIAMCARPTSRPSSCSSRRSSRLTPICPIAVSSRASSPGRSGTSTTTTANASVAPPCLPGIRRTPRLPAAIRSARARREPVPGSGSPCSVSSAAITSSSRSRTPPSTWPTAPALAPRISTHSRGSESAIRVVSRSPCPARPRAGSSGARSVAATRLDITCGTWETWATERSCAAASIVVGTEPISVARPRSALTARGSVPSWGTTTNGRPRNRSARAAITPEVSRPAMGCAPMYRGRSSG